jgi:archaellum component FlaC
MGNSLSKKDQEMLFDELIEVKLLYKAKEKIRKQTAGEHPEFKKMKEELSVLKKRIKNIETSISRFGESFFDVYDSQLGKPLSETDILSLRDEIKEVRDSLEAI